MRPPWWRMLFSAWRRSARDTPRPRKPALTKKQGTLQTESASSQASAGTRCKRANSGRRPYAHQPTGSPSMKASTPRDLPAMTSARCRRFIAAPSALLIRSPGPSRHHMHQHPAQAPFLPKSFSIAGQERAVSSRVSISTSTGSGDEAQRLAKLVFQRRQRTEYAPHLVGGALCGGGAIAEVDEGGEQGLRRCPGRTRTGRRRQPAVLDLVLELQDQPLRRLLPYALDLGEPRQLAMENGDGQLPGGHAGEHVQRQPGPHAG